MISMINRAIKLDQGIVVAVGNTCKHYPNLESKVIELPTEHYDFCDYDPVGKSLPQIEKDVSYILNHQPPREEWPK